MSFGSSMLKVLFPLAWLATASLAHLAAFHKGMYCLNGNQPGQINYNTNEIVRPLYQLSFKEWWFHHFDRCNEFPPAPGQFIDLPAGGSFTVEIASNRGKTSLSFGGQYMSDWPDGNTYPENYNVPTCITSPNMHTQNQSMAAGTAFAISYQSNIKDVTPENLVVFSVRHHTPWKRVTTYDVPAAMPPCPAGGCICAWGWVPNGCGEPNMFHQAFACNVSKSTSTTPLAPPKPPTWCEGKPSSCTKGAKQMVYWHQKEGNNIDVDGFDLSGGHKSPGYNNKCGFSDGAQNDIFTTSANSGDNKKSSESISKPTASTPASPSTPSSKLSCRKTNKRRSISNHERRDDVENHVVREISYSDTTLIAGIASHKRLLGRVGRGQS